MFFITIGFSASFELLKKGGVGVALFLPCAVILVVIQNGVGVVLAQALGPNPLIGLAAGSISLTGGHGTSAAFGPLLEKAGAVGALPAAIAASTYGLVAGCAIGGPVAKLLMRRHKLAGPVHDGSIFDDGVPVIGSTRETTETNDDTILRATILLMIAIGVGTVLVNWLKSVGFTLPAYLGPMLVAAIFATSSTGATG